MFTCFQRFTDAGATVGLERFKFRFDTERACTETFDAIMQHRLSPDPDAAATAALALSS